jgi:hypothetical protein
MGYSSDVTNTVNGKKYLISTAFHRGTGKWETAVLERKLFGIPNFLYPTLRIIAQDEHQARFIHGRVEEIVSQRAPHEWDSAERALVNHDLDTPTSRVPTTEDASPVWGYFRGKKNSNLVLEEKANAVTTLVANNCNFGLKLASAMKNEWPESGLGEEEARQTQAETAAFLLSVINPTAVKFLGSKNKDVFMRALFVGVTRELQVKGVKPRSFEELLRKRIEEYAQYREWIPEKDESAKDTLFWEYAKKIAIILNIGPDAIFNVLLTNQLLEALVSWKLSELLQEQA